MSFLTGNVPDLQMLRIPAGDFLMGRGDHQLSVDEFVDAPGSIISSPQHTVYLEEYAIGKYPVTNAGYRYFVEDCGHRSPPDWGDGFPESKADHPVSGISWNDAYLFCAWLSYRTNEAYHLPTEAQREKAACWDPKTRTQRQFPWGEEYETGRCNFLDSGSGGPTPVGRFSPGGDSAYGCADMSGNVAEWCHSLMYPYPYVPDNGVEDPEFEGLGRRAIRGADYYTNPCSALVRSSPHPRWFPMWGFRVARSSALQMAAAALKQKNAQHIQAIIDHYAAQSVRSEYVRYIAMAGEIVNSGIREFMPFAIEWLSTAIQTGHPGDGATPLAHAYYNRAYAYHQAGDFAAALLSIETTLKLDPQDQETRCFHRDMLLLNDKFEQALVAHTARPIDQGAIPRPMRAALLARASGQYQQSNENLAELEQQCCLNYLDPSVYLLYARNFQSLGMTDEKHSALIRYCLLRSEAGEYGDIGDRVAKLGV